ncbi:MAG: Holliday junction resolvase RecU [Thermacetogeniaceae bacterium]
MQKQVNLANRGRALEELLEHVFDSSPGVCMFRQANRIVLLRDGRAFPKKGAPVDFVGVINGIPVAVECKETFDGSIYLGKSRFPDSEIHALESFYKAGGRPYVVGAFWKRNILAVYGFRSFSKILSSGKKSLIPEDADVVLPVEDAGEIVKVL